VKLLLLTNLFPSEREPTRGIFNLNGFLPLARRMEMRVVCPLPWWSRLRRPGELFRAPEDSRFGIPAVYPTYWSPPRLQSLHGANMHRSLRGTLRRLRQEFPFDAILAAWVYPDAVAAVRAGQELGVPVVTMALGSDVNEFARLPGLRPQIEWALRHSTRVIAVSRALKERIVELGVAPERVKAQHNGVDGSAFYPRDPSAFRTRVGFPTEEPLITYVGNLKPEKGPDVLIEALGILKRDGAPPSLAIVGDGILGPSLRRRVEALGLTPSVLFAGRRPAGEVPDWIAAGDLLCLPSRREGCPNAVLEALASGRPVVASAVGGVPELISSASGALVPPDDPAALAAALRETLARPWDPAALRATVECLSWEEFAASIEATLLEAVAESKPRDPATKVTATTPQSLPPETEALTVSGGTLRGVVAAVSNRPAGVAWDGRQSASIS
jgi:glycosyltransferase involved in cell wall biosynthesis